MTRNPPSDPVPDAADTSTSDEDLEAIVFGMGPGEWAGHLATNLAKASQALLRAVDHLEDERRDTSDAIDAQAKSDVRAKAAELLAELVSLLEAMPIVQRAPDVTSGLRYLMESLYDVDRGAAPRWLVAKATKSHLKRATAQVQWLQVVTCVQLIRLLPEYESENKAAVKVSQDTGQAVSSIKRWCDKLYHPQKHDNPAAREAIETEVMQIRALMKLFPDQSWVWRRVAELLPHC